MPACRRFIRADRRKEGITMFSKKFIAATKEYSMGEQGEMFILGAPMFRRKFTYAGEKAVLTICGLGFYELYVNGLKVTKGKLAPYISNPEVCCYYDRYELTEYLKSGENVIGVVLGNGFLNIQVDCWEFEKSPFRSAPKLAVAMELDGKLAFEADDAFCWTASPITYNDLRYGERYDARLEIENWCSPDYDDSHWQKPIPAQTPKGEPRLCQAESIQCKRRVKSVAHWKIEQGYVYDFGENVAGVCTLKIRGAEGQVIRFQHGETLLEGRSLYIRNLVSPEIKNKLDWQKDTYICKGDPAGECYTPHFTYHGFRYIFVEGISDEQATDDLFTMEVWHSDFANMSSLTTDHGVVNQLQEMTMRSNLSNYLYIITDCPQREKNGWTGDIALSAEQLLYNMDCEVSMAEWLRNLCGSQNEKGAVPAICPTTGWGFTWGNGPAWDKALVELPYQIYRFTGNMAVVQESIGTIKRYIPYMLSRRNEEGLFAFGLPDWCETLSVGEHLSSTPLEVTDSLYCVEILEKSAFLAELAGETGFAENCKKEAGQLKQLFRKKYITEDCYVSCRTQAAQAMAIHMGIFTAGEEETAFQNLIKMIEEYGYFKTGALGARVLFRVLSDRGCQDLALKLITQKEKPSYHWWIDQGLTTLGESINETFPGSNLRTDGSRMLSLNHHFWGDISGWFYRYILGMNINPNMDDPNHIVIEPLVFGEIGYAKGSYCRNGNKLTVEVRKNADGKPEVTVLENTGFRLN